MLLVFLFHLLQLTGFKDLILQSFRPSLRVDKGRDGSDLRRSPLPSPQRPVQQSAAKKPALSQPGARSASSQPAIIHQPERQRTPSQPANLSGGRDIPLASNWPANLPAYSSRDDDPWAESWPASGRDPPRPGSTSASGWSHGAVPLQASFKPCSTPRCTSMSAVTTHVDDQCYVFVHELHGGACCNLLWLLLHDDQFCLPCWEFAVRFKFCDLLCRPIVGRATVRTPGLCKLSPRMPKIYFYLTLPEN